MAKNWHVSSVTVRPVVGAPKMPEWLYLEVCKCFLELAQDWHAEQAEKASKAESEKEQKRLRNNMLHRLSYARRKAAKNKKHPDKIC